MDREHMQKDKAAAAEEQGARRGSWPVGLYQIGRRYYAARQRKEKR